jgi:hypothetical protein
MGWVDQTGNQQISLIGNSFPSVTSAGSLNTVGGQWGFDLSVGKVKDAFLSGDVSICFEGTFPAMTSLEDATDYSLFGDLLFVRRDGSTGKFKLSDGVNVALIEHSWNENDIVTVVAQCDGDVMRVGVV